MHTRRKFLQYLGLGSIAVFSSFFGLKNFLQRRQYNFKIQISGANFKAGHLLRENIKSIPENEIETETVIVGGGISGLSAGWYFKKNKYEDFLILEMDKSVGGNSKSGKNDVSEYPYGAHYVPIPSSEAKYVRELFTELGIIEGFKKDLPIYNEFYLCADPHERLYFQGIWQEGLVPAHGIEEEDKKQYKEFFSLVEKLKNTKGKDGKPAFAIPMEESSQDKEFLDLDKTSMFDFMQRRGLTSRYLNWYVNYSCRDDYGVSHKKVSAWAGLHYFASRAGKAANADSQTVLTWPAGNGFLVQKLSEICKDKIRTNTLTYRIEKYENFYY
ncbi:MAG TPA: NAD(P)-binding protein, partial [Leptospiraceae bacterium]|nr:NAD(P)-binding protein [Leptospiraceae bacterium]